LSQTFCKFVAEINEKVIFSFKRAERSNKFVKASQLEMKPKKAKGQPKYFSPTIFKRGQISEIRPKKANLATVP